MTGTPARNPLIESCFPEDVVVVDVSYTETDSPPDLGPELRRHVEAAAPRRRQEFAFGRLCARLALEALGETESVVHRGDDRSPIWPPDVTGSISHTEGYAVAVVADRSLGTVGVDAERIGSVDDEVASVVLTAAERHRLHAPAALDCRLRTTLAFAAKEALFKAQHQLTGAWVDFTEVEVAFSDDRADQLRRAMVLSPVQGSSLASTVSWPVFAGWCRVGDAAVVGVTTQRAMSA